MTIPQHFSDNLSFEQQLLYALSKLKKGSVNEIAIEIMELKGISTEDEVEDLTIQTKKQLEKLCAQGQVSVLKEKHEKRRFAISNKVL